MAELVFCFKYSTVSSRSLWEIGRSPLDSEKVPQDKNISAMKKAFMPEDKKRLVLNTSRMEGEASIHLLYAVRYLICTARANVMSPHESRCWLSRPCQPMTIGVVAVKSVVYRLLYRHLNHLNPYSCPFPNTQLWNVPSFRYSLSISPIIHTNTVTTITLICNAVH